jgi:pyridoxal biosynthesis lyase PdxS
MKSLLIVTAAAETATGLALLGVPSLVVSLLFGGSLDTPAVLAVARITGAALISIGLACWLARNDPQSRAAAGVIAALSFYNAAAVVVLVHAGLGLGLSGIGLWPTVVLHAALAVWCVACLRLKPVSVAGHST